MTPQEEFDQKYINATEIVQRLNCNRTAILYERLKGRLPGSMQVGNKGEFFWVRADIAPYLDAWEQRLQVSRAKRASV